MGSCRADTKMLVIRGEFEGPLWSGLCEKNEQDLKTQPWRGEALRAG
jgi:hypothetical protein